MLSAFDVDHGDISKAKVPKMPSFGAATKPKGTPKMQKLGETAARGTKRLGARISAEGTLASQSSTKVSGRGYGRVQAGNRIQSFAGRMMSNPKKTGQLLTGGGIAGGTAAASGVAELTRRKVKQ